MIVVTAPTSTIGRQLVARLLEHDEPVRVIVCDPSKLTDTVRERVEVVVGSHRDRGVLDAALPGADALFWLMPADHSAPDIFDTYVTASIPGAEAVHRHGVERVVIVSALGRGSGLYAGHVSASLAMEDLFRSTGVHLRALANPSFMDNVLRQLPSLRGGRPDGHASGGPRTAVGGDARHRRGGRPAAARSRVGRAGHRGRSGCRGHLARRDGRDSH